MARLRRPVAVALFSAAALTYEVLLVRVFAIEQFHHFAYMAIGVAMLGFGASGTLLALGGRLSDADAERLFRWSGIAASLSLVASPILVDRIAFDATQLAWDIGQWPRLAGVYLCLAFPFGANALAILLGIALERGRPGRIYGASFLGSGLGAVLALVVLWLVFPTRALAIPALLAAAGAITCVTQPRVPRLVRASVWTTAIVSVAVFVRPLWTLDVNPYKGLPQVEAYPDARRVAEYTSPLGWVVAVEASAQRHAPGLSLSYQGELPTQTALFVDGQMIGAFARPNADSAAVEYLNWLPTALPYALPQRRNVLILGAGAGTEVSNAVVHDVDSVVAVELHPDVVRVAGGQAGRRAGGWLGRGRVEWIVGDARSYVARTPRRFDLITLGATGGMGTAAAGVHSLGEDFLHTVDAYVDYLDHLTPDGVLAITRWLTTPPRETVRVILTVADALHRASPETAGEGLFVMRSWATVTVLAKPSGFSTEDIESLVAWSRVHGFDVDWHTGLDQPIGEFHLLEEPVPFEAAAAGTAGGDAAADFAAGYPFAVHPVSDARPYPHHFLRPSSIGTFLTSSRGTWLPFAEWGYIALVATLIQSVVLAVSLTIVPVAVRARRAPSGFSFRLGGYFGAIGLAYLAAEIAAIQQLSLLLGHPIYAVAAVLAVFLMCSGLGSLWSDRLAVRHGPVVLGAAAFLLLIHATVLLRLTHLLQPFPLPIRALAGMMEVAPLAFLMGVAFPLGLRTLARDDTARTAWAWATNGFASVVAAPLAALIALEMGSPVVFLVAAIFYSVAAWIQYAGAGTVLQESLLDVAAAP